MKFFDFDIDRYEDASYIFIFGGRSSGKTTAVARMILQNTMDSNRQFVRMFRSRTDQLHGSKWFDNIDSSIRFIKGDYYRGTECIGYSMTISTEEKYKGNQYPYVKWLIFDEFVTTDSFSYRPFEPVHLMSAVSTIFRHRDDGKVILIGNNLNEMSKYNPYFQFFGFDWDAINPELGGVYFWNSPVSDGVGARCALHYVPMGYENIEEIPMLLKVAQNDVATTGIFAPDPQIQPNLFTQRNWWSYVIKNEYKIAIGLDHERHCILIGRYPGRHARRCIDVGDNMLDLHKFMTSGIYRAIKKYTALGGPMFFDSARTKYLWNYMEKTLRI